MDAPLFRSLPALLDVHNLLINKLIVLIFVLLFFVAVFVANKFFKRRMSVSKVLATIKIAFIGLIVLALESQLRAVSALGEIVGGFLAFIVLLCLANLVTYLVVDVYIYYKMNREIPSFIRDLFTLLIYVVFAMASLRVIFRLDLSSILTTTTVLTAAVAFAMQTTIANVFSGFYIQNDRNLRLKTWIALKDKDIVGEIVNVGFRYTTLRCLDGSKVMVPNNYIMQNVVVNLGYGEDGERSKIVLKVGLGYELPPEQARKILLRVLSEDKGIAKDPPPLVRLRNFADSCIEYELVYHLLDYSTHIATQGNLLVRTWYAVTREGHGIPYPHREVIEKRPREPFVVGEEALQAAFRRTEIFRSLSEEEAGQLVKRVHVRVFAPGEAVVRQMEEGDSLFIVTRGELEVLIDGGRVGTLAEGTIFGEMSLLTGEKRKATVAALTEVHLVEISKEDVAPVIKANLDLLDKLSSILAQREEMNVEYRKRMELSRTGTELKETFKQKLKAFFNL